MQKQIIQKLKCKTPGCGFIGDLLANGKAYDDIADKQPCEMAINEDGSFICLACGAPIYATCEFNQNDKHICSFEACPAYQYLVCYNSVKDTCLNRGIKNDQVST